MKAIFITIKDILPNGKIPRTTAQGKRQNRRTGRYYDSPEIAKARDMFMKAFVLARMAEKITEPYEGPVQLSVDFEYKARRKKDINTPKLTRPDCDNHVKLLQDCMTKAKIIKDDNQIFSLLVTKTWRAEERIVIKVFFGGAANYNGHCIAPERKDEDMWEDEEK